jgi:hypothetical protein
VYCRHLAAKLGGRNLCYNTEPLLLMTLIERRRERKARKLARLLVALDDTARVERCEPPRRSLRASLSGAR